MAFLLKINLLLEEILKFNVTKFATKKKKLQTLILS